MLATQKQGKPAQAVHQSLMHPSIICFIAACLTETASVLTTTMHGRHCREVEEWGEIQNFHFDYNHQQSCWHRILHMTHNKNTQTHGETSAAQKTKFETRFPTELTKIYLLW